MRVLSFFEISRSVLHNVMENIPRLTEEQDFETHVPPTEKGTHPISFFWTTRSRPFALRCQPWHKIEGQTLLVPGRVQPTEQEIHTADGTPTNLGKRA